MKLFLSLLLSLSLCPNLNGQVSLRINNVQISSSEFKSGDSGYDNSKKYPLTNIVDNNPKTAWVFEPDRGRENDSVKLIFEFDNPTLINEIELINGYAKSELLYKANHIISSFRLTFSDSTTKTFNCRETLSLQKFSFKEKSTKWVKLTALKIRKGTKYNDLCISEINLNYVNENRINTKSGFIIEDPITLYGSCVIGFIKSDKKIDNTQAGLEESITGYSSYQISPDYKFLVLGGDDDGCGHRFINLSTYQSFKLPNPYLNKYCVGYWTSKNKLLYYDMQDGITVNYTDYYLYDTSKQTISSILNKPINLSITNNSHYSILK